jgi:pimeloyl-ACP methyl ester carboxylesterase
MVEVASSSEAPTAERDWLYWTPPEWITVDGLETGYRRKGSGEPMLFLHGAGMTRIWLPLFEELSKKFDLIVPEHPGFGDTKMPETLEDFDDLVLHYDALLRALEIERPHVAGHSLGSWIGANLAIFYPTRFASLSLLAPMGLRIPEAMPGDAFRMNDDAALEALLSGSGEKYLDYFVQGDELETRIQAYSESITFARLTWNPRYDWRLDHRLARIQTPTLVLHPEDDQFVPRAQSERFAELIPDAELKIFPGADGEKASHLVILQQPEALAAAFAEHASAHPA